MLSCFVYLKFSINELLHRQIIDGEIPSPSMTLNVNNAIVKIQLNPVYLKSNSVK